MCFKAMIRGLIFVAFLASFAACKDPKACCDQAPFDRAAMLRHYADNLIQPAYATLTDSLLAFRRDWAAFQQTPSAGGLQKLRNAWVNTYTLWQSANAYNFGPAGETGLRKGLVEEIGTFPANVAQIETFIAAGDTSFNNFNRDTRGFLALEYLLFDTQNGSLLDAAPRRAYGQAVVNHLLQRVQEVETAWSSYADTFVNANGTDVGSGTSQLYNEFVRSFEAVKNFKVGLPAGKRPGQTQAEPQLVEAYYAGLSLSMLKAHLANIERIYWGVGTNGQSSGPSFKSYVESVVGGPELVTATLAQWAKVKAALAAVPTDVPLSVLMQNNHPSIEVLHTELQKQTRFFKSDMSSVLGIAITFSSGDGD